MNVIKVIGSGIQAAGAVVLFGIYQALRNRPFPALVPRFTEAALIGAFMAGLGLGIATMLAYS